MVSSVKNVLSITEERLELATFLKDFKKEFKLKEGKNYGILLTTGSFCPIHLGHINFLIEGKKFLEENFNYQILRILISPSCDSYVKQKSIKYKFENRKKNSSHCQKKYYKSYY